MWNVLCFSESSGVLLGVSDVLQRAVEGNAVADEGVEAVDFEEAVLDLEVVTSQVVGGALLAGAGLLRLQRRARVIVPVHLVSGTRHLERGRPAFQRYPGTSCRFFQPTDSIELRPPDLEPIL